MRAKLEAKLVLKLVLVEHHGGAKGVLVNN